MFAQERTHRLLILRRCRAFDLAGAAYLRRAVMLSDLHAVGVEQGEAVEMAILRIYYVDRKDIATEQVIVARAEPLHNLAHDAQERSSPSQHLPRPRTSGDNQPRGRISS